MEFLARVGFLHMVTPTTMAVVKDMSLKGDAEQKRQANLIIEEVLDSTIIRPEASDTYQQVLDIHADKLLEKGILDGGDKADALILAEASYFNASVLLTTNKALKNAQKDSLKVALLECGMDSVVIISPKEIVDYLEAQKQVEAHRAKAAPSKEAKP